MVVSKVPSVQTALTIYVDTEKEATQIVVQLS